MEFCHRRGARNVWECSGFEVGLIRVCYFCRGVVQIFVQDTPKYKNRLFMLLSAALNQKHVTATVFPVLKA